jgi:hypothetical protein
LIFTMKIEQVTKIEIKDLIHDLFKIIKWKLFSKEFLRICNHWK